MCVDVGSSVVAVDGPAAVGGVLLAFSAPRVGRIRGVVLWNVVLALLSILPMDPLMYRYLSGQAF